MSNGTASIRIERFSKVPDRGEEPEGVETIDLEQVDDFNGVLQLAQVVFAGSKVDANGKCLRVAIHFDDAAKETIGNSSVAGQDIVKTQEEKFPWCYQYACHPPEMKYVQA